MKANSNYVKQCRCCDNRFSRFSTPAIGKEHKDELDQLMRSIIKRMKLKGKFELICIDEFVKGFYYEYANASEELVSRDLCNRLYDVACDFFERNLSTQALFETFE